ncbi:hypothetical protein C4568_02545 [Candidatus Parcubacteria bacterium]|nr:MAG: hypothetical protein C4568_02545 [Candidatus Parcubacteria bacterium]
MRVAKPRLLVFASGTKDGGGSGFENLVNASRLRQGSGEAKPDLDADIVAVVSPYEHGGVRQRADRLGVPFIYFNGPFNAEGYSSVLQNTRTDYVALSGWMRHVSGLDPARTINIHPALLSFDHGRFGGKGMYGHHIHEAVKKALDAGEVAESGFTMHFVTEEMDRGPIIFECRVSLEKGMTEDEIAAAVNKEEHKWQPKITNMVVHGEIRWDGKDPASLIVPDALR